MKKIYLSILFVLTFSQIFSQNNRWDSIFTINNSADDTIFATSANGNNIFIGGSFDTVANIAASNVAYYNGTTWDSMGTGVNGNVYAIVANGSSAFVGGNFTLAGGLTATNLAIWNGTVWSVIGTGCNGTIRALESHNQYLYVGGDFTTIGGISANHIARYDGTIWEALGTGTDSSVFAINYGNTLTVGGNFTYAGGVLCNNIANWDGSNWSALADGFDGPVYSIDGISGLGAPIIAAGNFLNSGSTLVRYISLWNGSSWTTTLGGTNGIVYSIKLVGTSIFATGNFTTAGPQSVNNIAQWDGSNWLTLGDGLNNTGYCINNNYYDIICGGIFTTAGLNQSYYFGRYYSPPVISQQSTSMFKCEGENVSIFVSSYSGLPLTFQWEKDGTPIGTNNDSILINSVTTADSGVYICTVTNSIGSTVSLPITLTVNQPPLYSVVPSSIFCAGLNDSISPALSGSLPISYQWYKNAILIPGETNENLNFLPAALSDSGNYYCIAQNMCGADTTNIIKVSVFSLPNVTFSGLQNVYCENAISDTLIGIPSGGIFTGNGITDSIFTPDGFSNEQIITYAYTDINGCTNSFNDTTFINSLPYVSFTGLNPNYCFNAPNDTLSVNILGGVFSGAGLTDSIFSPSVAGAGNHFVYYAYTDLNGCVNTVSQTTFIYSPTIFTYFALDTTFCDGDADYTFSPYPSGGVFSGTIIADSTFSPQTAGLGNHNVFYTYSDTYGCLNIDTITMSVHAIPVVQITNLNTFYCQNETSVTLTGNPSGGTFTGNGIFNNILNPSLLAIDTFDVYYDYTDVYGCYSSDTASYSILAVADVYFTGLSNFYCPYDNSDTLTGNPSGGTFSGQGISGDIFSPAIAGSGSFYVSYFYNNLNGCISSDSSNVTVATLPNVQLPQDTTTCSGDSVIINSTGDIGIYLWSNLDTTLSIVVAPIVTTNYSVTVFDATCHNSDTITINVNPKPDINLGQDTSACLPFNLDAGSGYTSYLWSDGTTNSSITVNSEGGYMLTVTNSFSCSITDSVYVNANPVPTFNLGSDINMQTTQTIIVGASSSFSSYLWNTGSIQNFIVISGDTVGFGVHNYWLTVFNDYGCTYTDTIVVNVTSVGISDISKTENILIYPNPVQDNLFVKLPENFSEPVIVTIYNEKGKEMFKSDKHIANEIKIDFMQYAKGIYFVAIESNNKKEINKIIKN